MCCLFPHIDVSKFQERKIHNSQEAFTCIIDAHLVLAKPRFLCIVPTRHRAFSYLVMSVSCQVIDASACCLRTNDVVCVHMQSHLSGTLSLTGSSFLSLSLSFSFSLYISPSFLFSVYLSLSHTSLISSIHYTSAYDSC